MLAIKNLKRITRLLPLVSRPFFNQDKEVIFFEPAAIMTPAPAFRAKAWYKGDFKEIGLDSYKGKYVVLFFYPADFSFVCPTEIIEFSKKSADFRKSSKGAWKE